MKQTRTGRQLGDLAETHAEQWLASRGLRRVSRNFRCRRGEIDLIMRDGDMLVFVEVRLRRSSAFGGAAASVSRPKQRRLSAAAGFFLATQPDFSHLPCRFDVVAMAFEGADFTCNWIRDAFAAWE